MPKYFYSLWICSEQNLILNFSFKQYENGRSNLGTALLFLYQQELLLYYSNTMCYAVSLTCCSLGATKEVLRVLIAPGCFSQDNVDVWVRRSESARVAGKFCCTFVLFLLFFLISCAKIVKTKQKSSNTLIISSNPVSLLLKLSNNQPHKYLDG